MDVLNYRALWLLIVVAGVVVSGCEKRRAHQSSTKTTALPKIEACSLITAEEIQQVQGATLKDTKSNDNANGQVRVSQCYFAADPTNRSISFTVTQPEPGSGAEDAARVSWRESISRSAEIKPESDADREKRESLQDGQRGEEDDKRRPLKKIDGIGEEAFWAGSRIGGALYVLKGDVYVRISLGGPDTEEARIEKSKQLTAKALQRLK